MLEGEFNRKLKKALEARLPRSEYVVLKHNDMTTGGIPDFSISNGPRTIWVEVKMKGNDEPTELQADTLKRLRDGAFLAVVEKNGASAELTYRRYGELSTCCVQFNNLVETIITAVIG